MARRKRSKRSVPSRSRARRAISRRLFRIPVHHTSGCRNCTFAFLQAEWPEVYDAATRAAAAAHPDSRAACFYARRALELAVTWVFRHDPGVKLPYQENLSALIHEPTFKAVAGPAVFAKARLINQSAGVRRPRGQPPHRARPLSGR
jgi:hypothetical protein